MGKSFSKQNNGILPAIILAASPVVICIIVTLLGGGTVFDVWSPYSGWSDELFYFKQAESVAEFGMPQGFWGFNESSAMHGGFAAWGPLIIYPFALILKIINGAMFAPILLNLILLSVSLFLTSRSFKLDLLKAVLLAVGLCAFAPVCRYTLSYMSEILILSLTLVFFSLVMRESQEHSIYIQLLMCIILIYLISLRPYFVILSVFQWYSAYIHRKKSCYLFILSAIGGTGLYMIMGKYFKAGYFDGIYTDWLGKSVTHGPRLVIREIGERLSSQIVQLGYIMRQTIVSDNRDGGLWIAFFLTSLLLLLSGVICLTQRKKEKENKTRAIMILLLFATQVITCLAVFIMYNLFAGNRHLIVFIVLDIVFLTAFTKHRYISLGIISLVFVFIFVIKGNAYKIPLSDRVHRAEFESLRGELNNIMSLENTGWDNTVIVPDADLTEAMNDDIGGMEILYALPAGYAISYCEEEYVLSNIDSLNSSWLIAYEGSEADRAAIENGFENVGYLRGYRIYKRR